MAPAKGRHRVLALVLAGGKGERLFPLTQHRSKPAVPFGGSYRIIDFVLSNLINSGIDAIYVMTQYKAQSLISHIQRAWSFVNQARDAFATIVPAQMQMGDVWYRGTADAIYQNLNLIEQYGPDAVVIFGADHVYKMNIRQMVDYHFEHGAAATVACLPVPAENARPFGVLEAGDDFRIRRFVEKPDPAEAPRMPGRPDHALVSMGNYVFDTNVLIDVLVEDSSRAGAHDFGRTIFPAIVSRMDVYAYDFTTNRIPVHHGHEIEQPYWRDVGTIQSYFDCNMDLKSVLPELNLYNWAWPIISANFNTPPVKFVFEEQARTGHAMQSVISGGCIIAGGFVRYSILGRNVSVDENADVSEAILMDSVVVGRGARVHRAILDKNGHVPPGATVGLDPEADRAHGYHRDPSGITVVAKVAETPESRARYL
ncbi:MAG: glucose-1-phosphate adenylyltransferase [Terriglobales bacterium]